MCGANQSRLSPHTKELFVHHHNHDGHRESAQRWHAGDHRYVVHARGCVLLTSWSITIRHHSQKAIERICGLAGLLHVLETAMPGRDRNLRDTPNISDRLPSGIAMLCFRIWFLFRLKMPSILLPAQMPKDESIEVGAPRDWWLQWLWTIFGTGALDISGQKSEWPTVGQGGHEEQKEPARSSKGWTWQENHQSQSVLDVSILLSGQMVCSRDFKRPQYIVSQIISQSQNWMVDHDDTDPAICDSQCCGRLVNTPCPGFRCNYPNKAQWNTKSLSCTSHALERSHRLEYKAPAVDSVAAASCLHRWHSQLVPTPTWADFGRILL